MNANAAPVAKPKPARADRNRSLERGIEVLRAFRPGTDLLGNGELAERTGLSRATVSRLCQTLADTGLLQHARSERAYRLAAPVLSLAHAMRSGSPVLAVAGPLMRAEAEKRRINVGLAAADRDEMVYLESIRSSRRVSWRNVVAGQRVPIELTSLGRAWLAVAPASQRQALLAQLRRRRGAREWKSLRRELEAAIDSTRELGYCWASWQPEVVALATPIRVGESAVYVLNMSVTASDPPQAVVDRLSAPLLALAKRITDALQAPRD
ncbi:MAG TPA: IclR family transcriptional regulator [Ramlibacter sp.]|nr:IclR family transcriptional regulator [Ramlibacter sp.]